MRELFIGTNIDNDIRCRLNSSEEHTWHTSHGQINLIVDLIHNFYISWGKRQDELELKFDRLQKNISTLKSNIQLPIIN